MSPTLPLIIFDNATGLIYGTGIDFPAAVADAAQWIDADDAYMVGEARAHNAGRWSALPGVAGRLARNPWRWASATPELVAAVRAPNGLGGKLEWSIVDGVAVLADDDVTDDDVTDDDVTDDAARSFGPRVYR